MNLYNYYDPYGRPLPGVPLPPPLLRARALEQQAHAHALAFAAPQAGALHARPPLPPPQGPPGATGARLRKRASAAGAWPAGAGAMWTPARAQMPRLASRAATLGAPARPRRPSRRGRVKAATSTSWPTRWRRGRVAQGALEPRWLAFAWCSLACASVVSTRLAELGINWGAVCVDPFRERLSTSWSIRHAIGARPKGLKYVPCCRGVETARRQAGACASFRPLARADSARSLLGVWLYTPATPVTQQALAEKARGENELRMGQQQKQSVVLRERGIRRMGCLARTCVAPPRAALRDYRRRLDELLQRAAGGDTASLMGDRLGLAFVAPGIADFGIKEALKPTERLLSPPLYRTVTLLNSSLAECLIVLPQVLGGLEGARVLDDEELAAEALPSLLMAEMGSEAEEASPDEPGRRRRKAVLLPPGACYHLTVELRRTAERGLMRAFLCVAVAVARPGATDAQRASGEGWSALEPMACPVILAQVGDPKDLAALSEDAPPFLPVALKVLFSTAPRRAFFEEACHDRVNARAQRMLARSKATADDIVAIYRCSCNGGAEGTPSVGAALETLEKAWGGGQPLSQAQAAQRLLAALVCIEEAAVRNDLRALTIYHAQLEGAQTGSDELRRLRVPGLPEGRPSLALGDAVRLRPAGACDVEALTSVVALQSDTVVLRMPRDAKASSEFQYVCSGQMKVHASFDVDAGLMDAIAWALEDGRACPAWLPELLAAADRVLFAARQAKWPSLADAALDALDGQDPPALEPFNPIVNAEQLAVVEVFLKSKTGDVSPRPVCLFGPPGTGKSVTVVEAVRQTLAGDPAAKILVCAPSNFAADLLASQLAADPSGQGNRLSGGYLVRINAANRSVESVKADVLPFCFTHTHKEGSEDSFDESAAVRAALDASCGIIVATCGAATLLARRMAGKKADRRISHVCIDEAGQALFPEALAPWVAAMAASPSQAMLGLSDPEPLMLLAGDPRQLGPNVHSRLPLAKHLLGTSLLGVLMEAPGTRVQALRLSYRSSGAILSLPSRLFYRDVLVSAVEGYEHTLAPAWSPETLTADEEGAPCPPVCVVGVTGRQTRHSERSWSNFIEAQMVADVVASICSGAARVQDVGVMALFRRQVQLIRQLLRRRDLGAVRVGTVDDYQGQESSVVVLSTVLSRPESLREASAGGECASGAFGSARRFNVAITRAKALLVAVGHPVVLARDCWWKELVRHCASRGSYVGAGADALRAHLRSLGSPPRREASADGDAGSQSAVDASLLKMVDHMVLGAAGAEGMFLEYADLDEDANYEESPHDVQSFRMAI